MIHTIQAVPLLLLYHVTCFRSKFTEKWEWYHHLYFPFSLIAQIFLTLTFWNCLKLLPGRLCQSLLLNSRSCLTCHRWYTLLLLALDSRAQMISSQPSNRSHHSILTPSFVNTLPFPVVQSVFYSFDWTNLSQYISRYLNWSENVSTHQSFSLGKVQRLK